MTVRSTATYSLSMLLATFQSFFKFLSIEESLCWRQSNRDVVLPHESMSFSQGTRVCVYGEWFIFHMLYTTCARSRRFTTRLDTTVHYGTIHTKIALQCHISQVPLHEIERLLWQLIWYYCCCCRESPIDDIMQHHSSTTRRLRTLIDR